MQKDKARKPWRRDWTLLPIIGLVAVGLIAFYATHRSQPNAVPAGPLPPPIAQAKLAGLQTTPAPWKAELDHLTERLQAIGFPTSGPMGMKMHFHPHLDVFVNGKHVEVPAGIGISSSFMSPLHTHDNSGVIHVEASHVQRFTLGQFLAVWGVAISKDALGGDRGPVTAYVDGKRSRTPPVRIQLTPHEEIALVVGRRPAAIPSHYSGGP